MSIYPRVAHAAVARHTHSHTHTQAASAANVRRAIAILAVVHQDTAATGLGVEYVLVTRLRLTKIVHAAGRVAVAGRNRSVASVMGRLTREKGVGEIDGERALPMQKARGGRKERQSEGLDRDGNQAAMAS